MALHRSNEFHTSVKAPLAENMNKTAVVLYEENCVVKVLNQTPMFKTVLKQSAMHAHAHALLLISRQLVVAHKHRLKSVAQILMQHAHAVTKRNPIVLLVKPHDHLPLIASQQIVLITHHQHDGLTLLPEWKQPVDRRKALPMPQRVQVKLIRAVQRAQMTVGVQTEQTVQHRTEWVILRNEFKQTVV
jgi:hypothetical protein